MLTSNFYHSRQSIKKYVLANNKLAPASQNAFDSQFNKAIKAGVEKGDFIQPKGKPFLCRAPLNRHFLSTISIRLTRNKPLLRQHMRV